MNHSQKMEEHPKPSSQVGPSSTATKDTRRKRLIHSIAVISWSTVFLVFFHFFSEYVAYYERETIDGISKWNMYPLLTEEFGFVLPILTATLAFDITGHTILLIRERQRLRQIIGLVAHVLEFATSMTFLFVFPFDFTVVPAADVRPILEMIARIVLIAISVAIGVEILIRFIKLMIGIRKKDTTH